MSFDTEMAPHSRTLLKTSVQHARRHNVCLSALSASALSLLMPSMSEIALSRGSILWDANKPTSEVYFPVSGLISVTLPIDDESIEIANICRQAAVGPMQELARPEFGTEGVVQLAGNFIRVPASRLLSAAKENKEIENLFIFCREWLLRQVLQTAACQRAHTADRRFCRWLVQICERLDTDQIPLTQEIIASLLGIRRTTVTLIAQKLQARKLIRYSRGNISVLDRTALRGRACDCCRNLSSQQWPSTRLIRAA